MSGVLALLCPQMLGSMKQNSSKLQSCLNAQKLSSQNTSYRPLSFPTSLNLLKKKLKQLASQSSACDPSDNLYPSIHLLHVSSFSCQFKQLLQSTITDLSPERPWDAHPVRWPYTLSKPPLGSSGNMHSLVQEGHGQSFVNALSARLCEPLQKRLKPSVHFFNLKKLGT